MTMAADDDNVPGGGGPTGPSGDPPKRRRIAAEEEEEEEGDDDAAPGAADAAAADDPEGGGDAAALGERRRRQRLEARSTERRRRRLQAEAAELRDASFPGDEFYAGENMQEVPGPDVLEDPAMDADPMDVEPGGDDGDNPDGGLGDFIEDDGYGSDGDYVDDDAAAVLLGNRAGRRGRRRAPGDDDDDEGEGEDLAENMHRDYQPIAALDTYGRTGIDDRDFGAMDADERAAAERELNQRDREARAARREGGRGRGFYGALEDEMDAEDEDEEARERRRGRGRGLDEADGEGAEGGAGGGAAAGGEADDLERFANLEAINLNQFDVPLRELIARKEPRDEIQREFHQFLLTFRDVALDGLDAAERRRRERRTVPLYEERIRHMCAANRATLEVSYLHLMKMCPTLALWIDNAPKDMFAVLNEAAKRHALGFFPSYSAIRDEIHVRISDVPLLDSLRDLRRSHLDGLVKVSGVITRRSTVFPCLKAAYYNCSRCKGLLGPYPVEDEMARAPGPGDDRRDAGDAHAPAMCTLCDTEGPFRLNAARSQYRNNQRVNLQERPGAVPPGRVPRSREVLLRDDLVDAARPGEEIEVTGVYCSTYDYALTARSGFPVFSTHVAANHLRKREDASSAANLTEADRKQVLELAADPRIARRIVRSIAPSIYGHEHSKMCLALALFGAVPKNVNDKHRIRGDVNVLLLGDPGTAKSQMLKYAEATAPRAVYSTGKGASAVGLTASVQMDPLTREWTLEGGALVLADNGVCLIDEFDKMNEQDRTSIHEAMEQQSISISKAGIVTSLQARCSVIAAANPIGGRYDSSCTLAENVELTDPILQRFDCLCVLQDVVDPIADERLANFVTQSHMRSVPTSDVARGTAQEHTPQGVSEENANSDPSFEGEIIPQDLLRKYIQYARVNCRPALRGGTFDQEKIASLYVQLRKESTSSGGVPIAVRHIESIMRMAEAHAKMHLRDYVRDDDMDASIKVMLESFIGAQKFSVRRSLRRSFAKFMSSGEDRVHLLLHILQEMMRNEAVYQKIRQQQLKDEDPPSVLEVPLEELESRARDRRIYDVAEFCKSQEFEDAGYSLDTRRRVILRNYA